MQYSDMISVQKFMENKRRDSFNGFEDRKRKEGKVQWTA